MIDNRRKHAERGRQSPAGDLGDYHPRAEYFELAGNLFDSARREVLLVNGQMNGFPRPEIERFRNKIADLLRRSVSVCLICHPDELDGHGRQEFLERISRVQGAQARVSTVKVHGTFIVDRRWVLTWNSPQDRHCLLVRSPAIVDPMLRLTDAVWESACDLETFVHCHRNRLDEKIPQILQLLGSGCKDEVAAREIGVSVRTYRRYVATLMEKLDAESRFEAGVKATAFGLVKVGDRQRRSPAWLVPASDLAGCR